MVLVTRVLNPGCLQHPMLMLQGLYWAKRTSIQLRIKEHNRHIRLAKLDKSRVAEHSNNHDHIIKLQDTSNTDEPTRYNNDLLIYKINSTCFGQYFAHHQERKTEIFTAYGILLLWWVGRR